MPEFTYEALATNGQRTTGTLMPARPGAASGCQPDHAMVYPRPWLERWRALATFTGVITQAANRCFEIVIGRCCREPE